MWLAEGGIATFAAGVRMPWTETWGLGERLRRAMPSSVQAALRFYLLFPRF